MCVCGTWVEVRGYLAGVGSLLLLCRIQASNSGRQTWKQVFYSPSHQPLKGFSGTTWKMKERKGRVREGTEISQNVTKIIGNIKKLKMRTNNILKKSKKKAF